MSDKILTSWNPAIRWLLLPFMCIICPFILYIIASIFVGFDEGRLFRVGSGSYEITSFDTYFYECLRSIIFSSGFILPIIFLAPSYTKTTINIVRTLMFTAFIGIFIWFLSLDLSFSFWGMLKLAGYFICLCIGLFVDKFFDIED